MNDEYKKITAFTDLTSWQEAHKLVLMIYKVTRNFPKEELYELVSQIRRASVSITSNIAEGFSRQSYREKIQFYYIAQGSNTELQNQVIIAKDIGYLKEGLANLIFDQSILAHKLINGLIKKSKTFN